MERLNALIEAETIPGAGTKFTLQLPLTLAIITVLMVDVGDEVYALPSGAVVESLRYAKRDLVRMNGRDTLRVRDRIVPFVHLAELFGRSGSGGDFAYAVIVGRGEKRLGLSVDRLRGQQDVVIKALDAVVSSAPGRHRRGHDPRRRARGADPRRGDALRGPARARRARPRGGGGLSGAMYEQYWGLREKPFRKTPDPRYLFLNDTYEEALERLQFAVEEMELALLTGEVGSGKTLLTRALVDKLGRALRGRDDPEPAPLAAPVPAHDGGRAGRRRSRASTRATCSTRSTRGCSSSTRPGARRS